MSVKVRQSGQWVEVSGSSTSIPPGGIILWYGASNAIPAGFVLCDGNNGTPDLRDKFVVGAGNNYAVGATGGSANATLVEHSHNVSGSTSDNGSHSHGGGTNNTGSHTHRWGTDDTIGAMGGSDNADATGGSDWNLLLMLMDLTHTT